MKSVKYITASMGSENLSLLFFFFLMYEALYGILILIIKD